MLTGLDLLLIGDQPMIIVLSWKSKEQPVVVRSSAKAEYKAMAHTTSELTWLLRFLQEIGFSIQPPLLLFCDNQVAIHIAV